MAPPKKKGNPTQEQLAAANEVRKAVEQASKLRDEALARRKQVMLDLQAAGMSLSEIGVALGIKRQGVGRTLGAAAPRPRKKAVARRVDDGIV